VILGLKPPSKRTTDWIGEQARLGCACAADLPQTAGDRYFGCHVASTVPVKSSRCSAMHRSHELDESVQCIYLLAICVCYDRVAKSWGGWALVEGAVAGLLCRQHSVSRGSHAWYCCNNLCYCVSTAVPESMQVIHFATTRCKATGEGGGGGGAGHPGGGGDFNERQQHDILQNRAKLQTVAKAANQSPSRRAGKRLEGRHKS
jgi:hypothetical protein